MRLNFQHYVDLKNSYINSSFCKTLSIRVLELKEGACKLNLLIDDDIHMNSNGTVHGGVIASLLDSASGLSVKTLLGSMQSATTINLSINYLRPALYGELIAIAKVKKKGRNIATVESEVFNQEMNPLAHSIGTFMIIEK